MHTYAKIPLQDGLRPAQKLQIWINTYLLIQLVEGLGRQLVTGKQVDLILLEFSKAFDKVSHPKLLFKLSQHGVKGNTLYWIRAFFVAGAGGGELIRGSCDIWRGPGICSWASPLHALYKRPTTKHTSPGKTFCRRHGCLSNSCILRRDENVPICITKESLVKHFIL